MKVPFIEDQLAAGNVAKWETPYEGSSGDVGIPSLFDYFYHSIYLCFLILTDN